MVSLPLAVRPLAALIAAPMKLRGMPGELAKQNAMRNPRRTSSTAAALMIGLTLVVSMSVFASLAEGVLRRGHRRQDERRPVRHPSSAQGPGFSPTVIDAVKDVRRCRDGLRQRLGPGSLRRARTRRYSAVDPATAEDLMKMDLSAGLAGRPGRGRRRGLQGHRDQRGLEARRHGRRPSSPRAASTGSTIVGIYDSKGWITDNYVISLAEQNAFAGASARVDRAW